MLANSVHSLQTFVRPRATVVDRAKAPEVFWMPYDRALWDLGSVLADLQLGRFELVWRLPLAMRKRIRTIRGFFR